MESSDEELFNSHFSPDSLDKMVNRAPLKGHKLRNMERSRKTAMTKEYQLRERTQSNPNFTQVSEKINRMEALCKLLCKPVSVNIVKLSVSELQRWTESKSCNDSQGPLIEQRKQRVARQTVKQSSRKRKSSIPPREEYVIKKIHITDVLTDIKLPYIKVCRIDKILGEVVPNKECETRVQTECTEKSPVKLSTTDPEQLRSEPSNANELHNQCVNDKTSPCNNASSREYAADKDECSDDDQVCQNFKSQHFNRRRRRRRRVIYDSNDDSNAEELILQKRKNLKSVCPENLMGTYIPNDQNHVNEVKYADESETLQKQSLQKLDVARELSRQSSNTSEAISLEFDLNNVSNNVEKRNASTCAPLELNFECTTEDNVPLKLDNAHSRAVQERILKSKDIQEPMEKSIPSDKDLIERYKLFKELRVSLIKFNSAKNVNDNKYSATERQQLTAGNISDSTNTKFLNTGKIRFDLDRSEHSNCHTGSRKSNPPEPTQQILNLNICCTANRNTSSKDIQNVTESSSDNLMKSSAMSSETEKLRGTKLKKGKACHNLLKRIRNSGKEMSEKDTTQILEQESVVSLLIDESTLPPSSPHDSDKTLKLSNSFNDIVDSEKSENILHASSNEIPPLEEDISELLTPKLTPIKDLNTESRQKSANASTRPVDFKTVISQQNDITLKPNWIVSHKSAENISGTKLSTKKNSATCHSSTISPAKHKKPMDKRSSKGCIHKCIVCDSCFNDYSDLRKHLVMHTQKKKITSSTLSTLSKSSIRMSEQFGATTRRSSESGVAAIIQPSEQSSDELVMLESVADSGKKRKTKADTLSKCSPNKGRRKKGLKKPPASDINECTICSQIFPTETDLAAHIFLHTERELQNAYKIAKQKLEGKEFKRFKTMEKVTDNVNNAVDSNAAGKSLESLVPHDSETGPAKSATLCEKHSKSTESSPPIKLGKEKMSRRDNAKKCFRICNCHNKPGTNDNCLRIEIVHLCHTCRVLFRSMECLEAHYDMPEYAACNQNRLCKSPNLFCSTCGMVFGSVQHVRHHLEIHARFKQGCTMEFRCNICKLIFIGIGAQFYIHWSNHTKDPSWIATAQSLPDSITIAKSTAGDKCNEQSRISSNRSEEGYLQIAEYICHSCKLPFINNAELKDHISICKSPISDANTSILKDTDVNAQKYSSVKIVCSLCDKAFTEGLKFYKHITHDHEFNSEPQFTCVSLTTMKRTFICSLCMNVTESIDEFEDHWLLHCTRNILFTCTCGEISRNSFNSFLEHVKEHTIEGKVYVPSCTVSYEDTKTICTQCNLGFESSTAYDQHAVIHKSSNDVNSEEDEVTKTKQKLSEVSWITYNTNRDKENLIRILEGSDDSEPELVIDLTAQPEACTKSSEKEENVQTRYTPTRVSVAGTWTPSSERSLPITKTNIANASVKNENRLTSPENVIITEVSHHVTEAATVPVLPRNVEGQTSMITVSSPDTDGNFRNKNTEILKLLSTNFVENVHDNEGRDTALIRQQETPPALDDVLLVTQSTPSKKQSPPKPRKGFLRVKTLAELTGSASCSYNAPEKNNEKCTAIRDQLTSAESEKCIPERSQYRLPSVLRLKLLNPTQNLNASSTLPPAAVQKARVRVKAVAQSNTAVIDSKNAQQLQESINRRAYMSAPVESVTSTCYTNLPPRSMPRRTTSVPRSSVESNTNMTNDMIANSANTNMPRSCNSTANRNQPSPSFSNVMYKNDDNYRYKCKFCGYCANSVAECLLHDFPDPNSTCQKQYLHNKNGSNQTVINNVGNLPAMTTDNRMQNGSCHEGCQPITINQQMKYPSPPAYNQYHHLPSNSSNGSNYMFQRNHQIIIPNNSLIDNASSSIRCNNSNFLSGGVILANSQTHSVQSIPTIGILQQPAQQHMYQAPVCTGTEAFTIMDPSYVQEQQVYQIFQPKM